MRTQAPRRVALHLDHAELHGDLGVPPGARGLVLFAHGSGSSRKSERNRYVAAELQRGGLATLLVDLLTPIEEEEDRASRRWRFDIPLLGARMVGVVDWALTDPDVGHLPVGVFGASTGAAAALMAAAERPYHVHAVVSRGGRPDLAAAALDQVCAPTLLVVGGRDDLVLDVNEQAQARMRGEVQLAVIEGATHLFPEPGALEEVALLARRFFLRHLVGPRGAEERPPPARGEERPASGP